jgi:isopenicillin N synthase-like dioxygenase
MSRFVPVVDLAPFRDGTDRENVVRQVRDACERVGFLVVKGHGVPTATVDAIRDAAARFFAMEEERKAKSIPTAPVFRGFAPIAKQALSRSTGDKAAQPDLREGYVINRTRIDRADPYWTNPAAGNLFAENIWPDEADVPGFRAAWEAYYAAMEDLSLTLMRIFALALDLPEHYFDDKVDRHFTNLGVFHYPPQREPPLPGQLRGGAHTDFGSLTLVRGIPSIRGLQVWNGTTWEDVPDVQDSFVVNLGDLMAQWTNDRWVSTLHRVVNPETDEWNRSRYSIVFFHQPNYDALIECIRTCQSEDNPAKYEPITSGQHLFRKLSAMKV